MVFFQLRRIEFFHKLAGGKEVPARFPASRVFVFFALPRSHTHYGNFILARPASFECFQF